MINKLSKFITTGAYSGYLPGVPGTWGSLSLILVWWILVGYLGVSETIFIGVVIVVGLLATSNYMKSLDKNSPKHHDPREVVVDEWAGMAISLIAISPDQYINIFIAFVLFRLFDIAKPGPIGMSEKLPGALGVMADDIIAGMVVTFIMQIFIL